MRLLEPGRSARLPDDPRSVRLQADLHRFTPELSLFGGALIALLLVVTVGADLRGDAQCASLLARGFDKDLCTGIMQYPVTTIRASLQETADIVRAQHYLRDYSIAAVLAAVPLVPFFASIRRRIPRAAVLSLLAALAFTLPLFVLVIDWGRLLNIHAMAISILIAAFLLEERTAPGPALGVRPAWLIPILLLIVVYLTGWSIRHCCDAPLRGDSWIATSRSRRQRFHRRNEATETNGGRPFDGRRAMHADSCDVRGCRYKPLPAPVRFVSAPLTSRQAAFGGPSNASIFVIFRVLRG